MNSYNLIFWPRKAKTNSVGLCPLMVRITVKGLRIDFAANVMVNPKFLNSKLRKYNAKGANGAAVQQKIDVIVDMVIAIEKEILIRKMPYTIDYFKKLLKPDTYDFLNVVKNAWLTLNDKQKIAYLAAYNDMKDYYANNITDSYLMNSKTLDKMFDYFKKNKKRKNYKSYIAFLNICLKYGYKHELMFNEITYHLAFKYEKIKTEAHTNEEVKTIFEASFNDELYTLCIDFYKIHLLTGLQNPDIIKLFSYQIIEKDGFLFITGKRQKTNKDFFIPILPELKLLLEKYKNNIKTMPLRQKGYYLDLIGEQLGFKLGVRRARKTCSMIWKAQGLPLNQVAKILGHSESRTTELFYSDIVIDDLVAELKRIKSS